MQGPRPWRWPLDGIPHVLRGFAPPLWRWLPGHRGVDLASRPGQSVRAAGGGVITYAGVLAGHGVVAVLHPSGLRTTYLPVIPSVRPGRHVRRGDVIGRLEATPSHCPVTCLHWGLLNGLTYLDPLLLLGHGPVRLLPQWPTAHPHQNP